MNLPTFIIFSIIVIIVIYDIRYLMHKKGGCSSCSGGCSSCSCKFEEDIKHAKKDITHTC